MIVYNIVLFIGLKIIIELSTVYQNIPLDFIRSTNTIVIIVKYGNLGPK